MNNRLAILAALAALSGIDTGSSGTRPPRSYSGDKPRVDPQSNRSKKLTAKMDAKRARDAARKGKG